MEGTLSYAPFMERIVEHWWDGSWALRWRRDVWLKTDGDEWWVEARKGSAERGPAWVSQRYLTEESAKARVQEILDRHPEVEWRNVA